MVFRMAPLAGLPDGKPGVEDVLCRLLRERFPIFDKVREALYAEIETPH